MSNDDIPDRFQDIIDKSTGVFGADMPNLQAGASALHMHDSAVSDLQPQGAVYEFACDGCGRTWRLTLEYPELIALKFRLSPHLAYQGPAQKFCREATQWAPMKGNRWRLMKQCGCGWHLRLELSGREPEDLLRQARPQGYVQHEDVLQRHCQQMYQRLAQGQARR